MAGSHRAVKTPERAESLLKALLADCGAEAMPGVVGCGGGTGEQDRFCAEAGAAAISNI